MGLLGARNEKGLSVDEIYNAQQKEFSEILNEFFEWLDKMPYRWDFYMNEGWRLQAHTTGSCPVRGDSENFNKENTLQFFSLLKSQIELQRKTSPRYLINHCC